MIGKKVVINHPRYKGQYMMIVAKNQKVVRINKVQGGINYEANQQALRILSVNGYQLYMYLAMHKENWLWALSGADVRANTALTVTTYPAAVHELIEKGYLVPTTIDIGTQILTEDTYDFFESISLAEQNDFRIE